MKLSAKGIVRIGLVTAFVSTIAACGGGMDISDQELVKKMSECNAESNKTPGMAVSCGNYIKECKRRGEESGNYIC